MLRLFICSLLCFHCNGDKSLVVNFRAWKKTLASVLAGGIFDFTPNLNMIANADGISTVDGEILRTFRKARQTELDGISVNQCII